MDAKDAEPTAGQVRIGLSGWTYPPWRGVFYPEGLPQRRELAFAASRFRAIEINATFYRLHRPDDFARWANETPADFVFSVKGPRFITHGLRLRAFEAALANFLASGLLRLGDKLGPLLWQFPQTMRFDAERFAPFLAALPRTLADAARLARGHDERLAGRAWTEIDRDRPMRHAIEIRHDSFRSKDFVDLLRGVGAALVCADAVAWPRLMDLTSDFVYCRLHGSEELYASGYDDPSLADWARRIRAWARGGEPRDAERVGDRRPPCSRGRDVFVFFDNDRKVRAPQDAASLARRLRIAPTLNHQSART